jgi:hypothetical protein
MRPRSLSFIATDPTIGLAGNLKCAVDETETQQRHDDAFGRVLRRDIWRIRQILGSRTLAISITLINYYNLRTVFSKKLRQSPIFSETTRKSGLS